MDSSREEQQMHTTLPVTIPKKADYQQGLKQNFFNPSKDSPPNVFLLNLTARLNDYYEPPQVPSGDISDS